MNTATQDGPFDMYVEDLASLLTVDQNTYLSVSTASWNSTRHVDPKVDEFYARYAREMDPARRKAIAREFQEFSADKLYWNTISGSPFYQVAQPWICLLYTSDAADERSSVDLGGRRIIKKKKNKHRGGGKHKHPTV